MGSPYYIIEWEDGSQTVFDASSEGAIAPDGNLAWLDYQSWLAEDNLPEVREF